MNTYYNGQEAMIMQINISCNTVEKFREVTHKDKNVFNCNDVQCHNVECEDCIFEYIDFKKEDLISQKRLRE